MTLTKELEEAMLICECWKLISSDENVAVATLGGGLYLAVDVFRLI